VNSPNRAYAHVFPPDRLTVGLMTPAGQDPGRTADVDAALRLAIEAEQAGFAALWARDVPLMIPQGSAGIASAVDDPFVWLTAMAGATSEIVLALGAAVLPLRHPLHLAKAAMSLDRVSKGRFILGAGSGDRPEEFAAFGAELEARGHDFAERWMTVRHALSTEATHAAALAEATHGYPILPSLSSSIPMLVVGSARQSLQWIATHADGWATYHREATKQQGRIGLWEQALAQRSVTGSKPFIQSVHLDLQTDPSAPAQAIELGIRGGSQAIVEYLTGLRTMGVAHVLFNLAANGRAPSDVIAQIGTQVLPALERAG